MRKTAVIKSEIVASSAKRQIIYLYVLLKGAVMEIVCA